MTDDGPYTVTAKIGEGGMGQVYRTDYVNLDRSPRTAACANGDPAELRRRGGRSRRMSLFVIGTLVASLVVAVVAVVLLRLRL